MTSSNPGQVEAQKWSTSQRWTLGVTSMASFMAGMDALVVTTALPTIHADLGASTSALSWTVAAYALGFAAVVLAGTAFGDRYGRRRMFLAGVALFTLASAGCAVSPDVVLFMRSDSSYLVFVGPLLLAGVGSSLAFPTTASATMRAVNFDQMGPAGGVGTVAFQLGAALGVSVVSAVFSSAGGYTSAPAFVDGMRPALLAIGVITALGIPAVNRFRAPVAQAAPAATTADRSSEPALTAGHLLDIGSR